MLNPAFIFALISAAIISLGSLLGILTLAVNKHTLNKILLFLISLSAGTLMGGAFLHLLPEAAETLEPSLLFSLVLLSFVFFFLVEKIFRWRHCHKGECDIHSFGIMNLIGDSIHNFIDGLIIAATFATDIRLGIISSFAVALHEIPQEIGDFGVLVYAGYGRRKALLLNLAVAATAILGVIVGFLISGIAENLLVCLIPFAAGGFIYISASDLMPEIRKETNLNKSLISFAIFSLGIAIMFATSFLE
jgi:zinc and cadmium transporter